MSQPAQRPGRRQARPAFRLTALALALCCAGPLWADPAAGKAGIHLQQPAQPLGQALSQLAAKTGLLLGVDASLVAGKTAPALDGWFAPDAALVKLLAGSGLEAVPGSDGTYTLRRLPARSEAALPEVKVTASGDYLSLPTPYAGGQVARGARLGMLGNRDVMDTPFNITAYTADVVENQQARTVADVLANEPSARYTVSAGHLYENFRLRGFDVFAGDLSVNGLFGMTPQGHVPVEFLERVEVLKGPGAMFTGMPPGGGVGGVVNLVTKRAADDPLTRVTVDYTSDSQIGTHLDLGRRFGPTKQIGLRVNAAHREGDTTTDGQQKKRDFLSVGADYRGEALVLSGDFYYSKEEMKGGTPASAYWFADSLPSPLSAPDAKQNLFPGAYGTLENMGLMLRADYEINDKLSVYGSLGTQHYDYWGFINGTHARNIQANGNFTGVLTGQYGFSDSVASEIGLKGRFKTGDVGHDVVVSTSGLLQESGSLTKSGTSFVSNIYNPAAANVGTLPRSARKTGETTLTSLAIADTLSFLDEKVLLTLGLRDQRVRTRNFDGTSGVQTSSYDKSAVTPSVGLVVKPWAAPVSLYGNYIEGLSKGDTVTDVTATNYGHTFAPYKTEQKEVGVKWEAGKFANTVSLFELTKPGMMKVGNAYTDGQERRHRGIEWNTFGEVSRNVRLLGGATYTKAELTRTQNGTYDGNTAIGVPEWQATLGSEWDTPWVNGLTLTGRLTYNGKFYLNAANTHQLPAWTILDLGARYTTRVAEQKVVFRANVNNVFDKNYFSGSFSDSYSMATIGAPRSVSLSASVDF